MYPISFGIAGGGTAGLISALMLRQAFPNSKITLIASSDIGIIGVGEGSTEHWKGFMNHCDIPLLDLIAETEATHKYGIRFENWSKANPDYFHSVSGDESIYAWQLYPVYMYHMMKKNLLTDKTGGRLRENKIREEGLHENTNQFHFNTFALNNYLSSLAFNRQIQFVDRVINEVNLNPEQGYIESVTLDSGDKIYADFWLDCTGFKRVLMSKVSKSQWNSFSDYLLVDSAFAFPTEPDPSGEIRPYTRAKALSSGWAFEIPTQTRRGNGYVYSSKFITEEDAIKEMSLSLGEEITPVRKFKFDPGHLTEPWVKNCCAVGLSSSFVEPLEATSIGSSIQQMFSLIPLVASYRHSNVATQKAYNKRFNVMMDNILLMIRLHYLTDRDDTDFWKAANSMPIPEILQELLDLWQETTLPRNFISSNNGEMFLIAHLLHVAQGQNLVNIEPIKDTLENLCLTEQARFSAREHEHMIMSSNFVDHAEAIYAIEKE